MESGGGGGGLVPGPLIGLHGVGRGVLPGGGGGPLEIHDKLLPTLVPAGISRARVRGRTKVCG